MAFINCNNCGARIDDGAKFCRQCGQPVSRFDPGPRGYVSPTDYEAPTQPMNPGPTMPSYYPGQNLPPMPVPSTNQLGQGSQTRKVVGIVVLIMVLLFGLMVLSPILISRLMSEGPTATAPRAPADVPVPPAPPGPPAPPAPPAAGERVSITALMYPGAKQVMEIMRGEEGNVLQLETSDPADKIAAWYAARINPTKQLTLPAGVRLLQGQGVTVVITPGGDDMAQIIIKQGVDF